MKVLAFVITFLCILSAESRGQDTYLEGVQTRPLSQETSSPTLSPTVTNSSLATDAATVTVSETETPALLSVLSPSQSPTGDSNAPLGQIASRSSSASPTASPASSSGPDLEQGIAGLPAIHTRLSILVPIVSLGLIVWAAGKHKQYLCCSDAFVDIVPREIIVPSRVDGGSVAGDSATDIELVPVETFESWTAGDDSHEEESASYVRMV